MPSFNCRRVTIFRRQFNHGWTRINTDKNSLQKSVDQTAISRIENQTRYLMDYEVLAIAKVLEVSAAHLHGESK
jgi:hypothetical protein